LIGGFVMKNFVTTKSEAKRIADILKAHMVALFLLRIKTMRLGGLNWSGFSAIWTDRNHAWDKSRSSQYAL
jgi:hypothetical protein